MNAGPIGGEPDEAGGADAPAPWEPPAEPEEPVSQPDPETPDGGWVPI